MKRGIKLKKVYGETSLKWLFVLVFIALILFIVVYFFFFRVVSCDSPECFGTQLSKCHKASFIRDTDKAIWQYQIIRESKENSENCEVKVKLLEIKQGSTDSEILEGKSMTCDYFKLNTNYPEEDISKCTGILKEQIQELIIKRTHDYILKNLEDIENSL